MCACEVCALLMKKCVTCRSLIQKQVSFSECCTLKKGPDASETARKETNEIDPSDMHKLQQQLQDIKDQVYLKICLIQALASFILMLFIYLKDNVPSMS